MWCRNVLQGLYKKTTKKHLLRRSVKSDIRSCIIYFFPPQNRPKGGITGHKAVFAKDHTPVDKLEDAVKVVKPTAIIGKSLVNYL